MLDEKGGQPEQGGIVSLPSFLGGFVNPPKREEPLNQVSGAPSLAADAQVGFVIKGLMLQVQPAIACSSSANAARIHSAIVCRSSGVAYRTSCSAARSANPWLSSACRSRR